MSKLIDLIRQRFGRLTVIQKMDNNKWGHHRWLCQCSCSDEKKIIILGNSLKNCRTRSCGCLQKELTISRSTKHGHTPKGQWSPIYLSWKNMIQRCINPDHKSYHNYGGRGITIYKRWLKFENFLEDMGKSWKPRLTIERRENDKGYCKKNCYWATRGQQQRNTRRNHLIKFNGKIQCLIDWAEEIDINPTTLWYRLARGWSIRKAMTTSVKKI